jgi:hypothetical protein
VTYSIVLAGLTAKLFDRIRKLSENRLAPNGKLILKPTSGHIPYSGQYIEALLSASHEYVRTRDGRDGVATLLMYVDYADQSTKNLLKAFFPFGLPMALDPVDFGQAKNGNQENALLNAFAKEVDEAAIYLRGLSTVISEYTSVANLTPLLLPLQNFHSQHFRSIVEELYFGLAEAADAKQFISSAVKRFFSVHPRTHAGTEDRHCLSDGYLYFRSPGKDRHGFFRNDPASNHALACLLGARSRIGGRYSATFHYDCVAVNGSLAAHYSNCHGAQTAPNSKKNVNISPNDFVR